VHGAQDSSVHRLSCYIYIPKYSKLFIQIVWETSVRENDCPGNVLSGKRLSRKVIVRETSVTRLFHTPFTRYNRSYNGVSEGTGWLPSSNRVNDVDVDDIQARAMQGPICQPLNYVVISYTIKYTVILLNVHYDVQFLELAVGYHEQYKPNSITLASSELAPNMFGASSELASVMEFGFILMLPATRLLVSISETAGSWDPSLPKIENGFK